MNEYLDMANILPDWINCSRCGLSETRSNMVFGSGNPHADCLLIGEAPGEEEDKDGFPFTGPSGKILTSLLNAVRLDRQSDFFITNVVGCRPYISSVVDGKRKTENRTPSSTEREACWPRLEDIIYRVDPLIIVTMGKTPTTQVLRKRGLTMESIRGQVQTATLPGHYTSIKYPVLPMFHPAYLLRNQDQTDGGPWHKTAMDFVLLSDILDHLRNKYYGRPIPNREEHLVENKEDRKRR